MTDEEALHMANEALRGLHQLRDVASSIQSAARTVGARIDKLELRDVVSSIQSAAQTAGDAIDKLELLMVAVAGHILVGAADEVVGQKPKPRPLAVTPNRALRTGMVLR